MLHAGQIVDRYEVEEELGAGGMAVVYRVRHRTLGSKHALKVLTAGGDALRERLLAEGRAQGQLQHPNALNVTDIIDVDGQPGLVMEYVSAGTLEDWLERERPDRDERIAVFKQIVEAMAAAHEQGWIHRDLKPSNVLMDHLAGRWVPKVADFGLVKAVVTPLGNARTRQGIAMGTPGFMSNEQFTDASTVTAAADVFSLGCILVWLITEVIPFEGDTPVEVYQNVAANSRVRLKPSDPLYELSERCLDPDPSRRPQDAGALLEALGGRARPAVDFGVVPSRTPAPAERQRRTPASVSPRSERSSPVGKKKTSVLGGLAAMAGCGGMGVAGGLAVAVLVVGAVSYPTLRRGYAVNQDVCNLNGVGSLGTIEHAPVEQGTLLVLRRNERVTKHTAQGESSCLLPRGTRVRVGDHRGASVEVRFDEENALPTEAWLMRVLFGAPRN